jgi:tetratricopeptide (TPR) repeat protein
LEQFAALGDQAAQAMAQNGLSQLLEQQGQYAEALAREKEVLRLRLDLGNRTEIAHSEQTIGSIYARLGKYDEALLHCSPHWPRRRAASPRRYRGGARQLAAGSDDPCEHA